MSCLDKIKAKFTKKDFEDDYLDSLKAVEDYHKMRREMDERRAEEAAKWATIYKSSPTITGGFPLGIGPSASGYAWVEGAQLENRCKMLMKKLNITTAAEFDKVFGEIIDE